jgi:hypothetical protein
VKYKFMAVAKLEACHMPEDPAFPAPVDGYTASFVVFYEQGFGTPPLQFLELHHLTPSGVLHIVAFVTLCEANLGIDPEIDLCKYFFHVWRP